MNLLIINLLIASMAFAAFGAHPWVRDPWSECKLETNGLFMLEKECKNLQICYQSKLAGKLDIDGKSKFGGRFGLKKRVNDKPPFFDCAVVMGGRGGWHGLNITRNSDGNSSTIQSRRVVFREANIFAACRICPTAKCEFALRLNVNLPYG
uniref:Uncharacterized protein n=1 Tax=Globodera rostochiensis TaxID=31243 RepID=A0A914HTP9_GLORO